MSFWDHVIDVKPFSELKKNTISIKKDLEHCENYFVLNVELIKNSNTLLGSLEVLLNVTILKSHKFFLIFQRSSKSLCSNEHSLLVLPTLNLELEKFCY